MNNASYFYNYHIAQNFGRFGTARKLAEKTLTDWQWTTKSTTKFSPAKVLCYMVSFLVFKIDIIIKGNESALFFIRHQVGRWWVVMAIDMILFKKTCTINFIINMYT